LALIFLSFFSDGGRFGSTLRADTFTPRRACACAPTPLQLTDVSAMRFSLKLLMKYRAAA
jgi:hypothetical protein